MPTINMAVMDSVLEVVEGDDAVREDREWDADEFGFRNARGVCVFRVVCAR